MRKLLPWPPCAPSRRSRAPLDARRRGTGRTRRDQPASLLLADDGRRTLRARRHRPADDAGGGRLLCRDPFRIRPAGARLRKPGQPAAGPGVHVACSATFAMRWLVPQLAVFYRKHPDIRIRLSMTSAREIRNEARMCWWRGTCPATRTPTSGAPLAPVNFAAVCVPACARLAAAKRTRIAHGSRPAPGINGRPRPGNRLRVAMCWSFRTPIYALRRRCPAWESPWWKRD